MLICPSCGRESPPDAAFCARCGTSLEALRPPGLEERKVVTVLFADLVGSTALAESHDPEEVRSILTAYYARLRVELERHGGTVEKFIGDAVMAVFGAPVAHEDDPERAVRAALAIRDGARRVGGRASASPCTPARRSSRSAPGRRGRGDGRGRRRQHGGAPAVRGAGRTGSSSGETTYRATAHAIDYART